jgi:hypothetical protein
MQTKQQSLIESLTQTAIGFLVSLFTWYCILWTELFDITVTFTDNLVITGIFTVVSIIRGYLIRRFYNKIHISNGHIAWPTYSDTFEFDQTFHGKHIYIVGHGRHGKDTVAEILRDDYGLKFTASSWFMAGKVVFPALKNKYGYKSVAECFDDRHNHRAEWFDLIDKANPNGTELSEAIFKENEVYIGIRNKRELDAVKADSRFNPLVIWVDASKRTQPEPESSMTIKQKDANYILDNNGTIDDLKANIFSLMMYGVQHE